MVYLLWWKNMVNIIICDDNKKDLKNVVDIVKEFMKKNNVDYNLHIFEDYNDKFTDIIYSRIPFKIYLLDIEAPSGSGIDIAREIRRKDVESIIMFLTGHEELGNIVLKNDLLFLSFINKFDDMKNRLNKSLKKSLELLKHKNIIRFEDRNVIYTLNINDILYITKESNERKTIIKTDYIEFKVNKSLSEVIKMLDSRFVQTHRACFINYDRKTCIDKKKKIIIFDNGEKIDLLSNKYKGLYNI